MIALQAKQSKVMKAEIVVTEAARAKEASVSDCLDFGVPCHTMCNSVSHLYWLNILVKMLVNILTGTEAASAHIMNQAGAKIWN